MVKHDWDSLPAFFGPKELAKFLGVGTAAAYRLVRQKDFPVLKIGRQYRISRDGLQEWVKRNCSMINHSTA